MLSNPCLVSPHNGGWSESVFECVSSDLLSPPDRWALILSVPRPFLFPSPRSRCARVRGHGPRRCVRVSAFSSFACARTRQMGGVAGPLSPAPRRCLRARAALVPPAALPDLLRHLVQIFNAKHSVIIILSACVTFIRSPMQVDSINTRRCFRATSGYVG